MRITLALLLLCACGNPAEATALRQQLTAAEIALRDKSKELFALRNQVQTCERIEAARREHDAKMERIQAQQADRAAVEGRIEAALVAQGPARLIQTLGYNPFDKQGDMIDPIKAAKDIRDKSIRRLGREGAYRAAVATFGPKLGSVIFNLP